MTHTEHPELDTSWLASSGHDAHELRPANPAIELIADPREADDFLRDRLVPREAPINPPLPVSGGRFTLPADPLPSDHPAKVMFVLPNGQMTYGTQNDPENRDDLTLDIDGTWLRKTVRRVLIAIAAIAAGISINYLR